VLKEELAPHSEASLERIGWDCYVGLEDQIGTGTSLMAHGILGADPDRGWLALDRTVAIGTSLSFMRLSREAAEADLRAMLARVVPQGQRTAKGPSIFPARGAARNCSARRRKSSASSATAWGVPVIGFFGSGEICYNRIRSFTGVLAVFF